MNEWRKSVTIMTTGGPNAEKPVHVELERDLKAMEQRQRERTFARKFKRQIAFTIFAAFWLIAGIIIATAIPLVWLGISIGLTVPGLIGLNVYSWFAWYWNLSADDKREFLN